MKMTVLSLLFSGAVSVVLLQCVSSQCSTPQDCYPDIVGFNGNISENAIRCDAGTCVCDTCFETGSEGTCALRPGCWQWVSRNEVHECVMLENTELFTTTSAILFGVSAAVFIIPLILAGVIGLLIVVFYDQCNEKELPKRFITPLLATVTACFWTISVVLIIAGIIVLSTSGSPCLQEAS